MTKRKNLLVLICTLMLMCIVMTGCAGGDHESAYIDDDDEQVTENVDEVEEITVRPLVFLGKFKIEGIGCSQYIFYDPDNLVMYSYFSNTNDRGPEPMVNPDGTYKIYDPETWLEVTK